MITDGKHTNRVTIWLTDREYMDLCCMADAQDRKSSEMARFALRSFMYGQVRAPGADDNVALSVKQHSHDHERDE